MREFLKALDEVAEKLIAWLIAIPIILSVILIPITITAGCLWLLTKIFGG